MKAELAERIAAKKVLVVVGAGVSLVATGGDPLASWKGLITNGIERCVSLGLRDATWGASQKKLLKSDLDDLLGVAEQVSRRLGWKPTEPCGGDWNRWLRRTVGSLHANHPELIKAIRDLGAPIATLNYDDLLGEVTHLRTITWQRAERWQPVLQGDDEAILHLHGHWREPSSVVLGVRSYDATLGRALAQHLQRALASLQSLVFIGCSGTLEDPNFSSLLTWIREQLSGAEHSNYLLIHEGEPLPSTEPLLREARIVPLHCGKEHADLLTFVRNLAKQALAIQVEFNAPYEQASTYQRLGMVAQEQRRWAEAEQYYQQALAIQVEFNARYEQASTYQRLGMVAQEQRRWEEAEQYYQQARAQDPFTTLESDKAEIDATLFERNRESSFRVLTFDVDGTSFFADCSWNLAPNFNVLLGRNGYGKSYILHAIVALLVSDYKVMAELFPANEGEQHIGLSLDYQRHIRSDAEVRQTRLEFRTAAANPLQSGGSLRTRIGPVPLLAIPDLRFIDQSNLGVSAATGEFSDIVRTGTTHFLRNQPIVGLIHTMLYQICLDYLQCGTLKLPSIQLLERVITRLSGAPFAIHKIRRSLSSAQFEIQVMSEGLESRPIPLQRASQGTLSTVAVIGLIERFLRALIPNTPPEDDVCARPAIVIIDELDAHLHPTWQRIIVPVLRETFPHVQFITSAHSPLVIAECLESEVAVLRKMQSEQRFLIESDPLLIGEDLQAILREVFETDPISSTISKYLALLGNRRPLESSIANLRNKESLTSEQETELGRAEVELERLNRAERIQQRQMRIEDLEEYEDALKARLTRLEARAKELERDMGHMGRKP